jgi:hypothetical protein
LDREIDAKTQSRGCPACQGWEQLGRHAPGPANACWQTCAPTPSVGDHHQHPLKGRLAQATVERKKLDQWQHEITGAGRVWYCLDRKQDIVWMTHASVGHPKARE